MGDDSLEPCAPLLRWAGGKRWLVPEIDRLVAQLDYQNYHEPFAGGAAVFFGLDLQAKAYLSDLNSALMEMYSAIAEEPDEVWRFLRMYRNDEASYYRARSARPRKVTSRAARFIYLNHSSYNGIYRVNLAGQYNVPYGFRKYYKPPLLSDLRIASQRLKIAALAVGDFADVLENVGPGDLVFLDPPYTVSHDNSRFVKYNEKLFSFEDQRRLRDVIRHIREAGAFYILTNAAHKSIEELFGGEDAQRITNRKNVVGGRSSVRGIATEMLFTNIPSA